MNQVLLAGRLSAAEERPLPSGDVLVAFRIVVPRPPATTVRRARSGRPPTVDVVDCVAWRPALQRSMLRWAPGDWVRVEGRLVRRFWRSRSEVASRSEVEVTRARRIGPPPAPG